MKSRDCSSKRVSTRLRFLAIHLSHPFNIGRRHHLYPLHEAREMVVPHPIQSARHPYPGTFFYLLGHEMGVFGGVTGTGMATPSFPNPHTTSLTGVMHSKFLPKKPELSTYKPVRIATARGSGTNPRTVGTAHSPEPTGTGS